MSGRCSNANGRACGVVLLNEPDESVRDALTVLLQGENWTVKQAGKRDELAAEIAAGGVTAVVSESSLPESSPAEILDLCKRSGVPVVFTGHDIPLQGAVDLIRQGAVDFLDKPFPQSRLLDLLEGLRADPNE
jgi:FixJ family two-component response regulator